MVKTRRIERIPVGAEPDLILPPRDPQETILTVLDYGPQHCERLELVDFGQLAQFKERPGVTWIDVRGLGRLELIREIAELFEVHPLALADVFDSPQTPKTETYGDTVFIVTRYRKAQGDDAYEEQVATLHGRGWLISFQERQSHDPLQTIRQRIERAGDRFRGNDADYLAYAIIDLMVDSYFPVLDASRDALAALEQEAAESRDSEILRRIQKARQETYELSRFLRQQRKAAEAFGRLEAPQISDNTRLFLRDALDHCTEQVELAEQQTELARGIRDFHLAMLNHRMNEVMHILTVIATIFIPLSFFASVYGMNFAPDASELNMPELRWRYGYVAWWTFSIATALTMLLWFRKRGFLGGSTSFNER